MDILPTPSMLEAAVSTLKQNTLDVQFEDQAQHPQPALPSMNVNDTQPAQSTGYDMLINFAFWIIFQGLSVGYTRYYIDQKNILCGKKSLMAYSTTLICNMLLGNSLAGLWFETGISKCTPGSREHSMMSAGYHCRYWLAMFFVILHTMAFRYVLRCLLVAKFASTDVLL